jgi:hypothetical protein
MLELGWQCYCGNTYMCDSGSLSLGAGIFKQSVGARNRLGIGLSYRPSRLHRMVELIPWNLFLGSLKVKNSGSVSSTVPYTYAKSNKF